MQTHLRFGANHEPAVAFPRRWPHLCLADCHAFPLTAMHFVRVHDACFRYIVVETAMLKNEQAKEQEGGEAAASPQSASARRLSNQ
jgi:hypothetical protein